MDRVDRAIEKWAEVSPALETGGMAIVARIGVLQQLAQQRIDSTLAPLRLSPQAYSVVAVLLSHGAPEGQLTPSAIRSLTLLTSGGVSNILRRLEEAEMIARHPDPDDGRGTVVRLTTSGRELAERAVADVLAVENDLVRQLPERQRKTLTRLLAQLLDAVDTT